MKSIQTFVIAAVASMMVVGSAWASPVLMSLDGESESNILRAVQLGHTVTGRDLEDISVMTQAQLGDYRAVFVNPDMNNKSYAFLRNAVADGGSLQQYVANGGILVVNAAGRVGSQQDIAPGGIDYDSMGIGNIVNIAEAAHPYVTGQGYGGFNLNDTDFQGWFYTHHGHVNADSLRGKNPVVGDVDVLQNDLGPAFVEYEYGEGRVVVTTLTVGWAMGGEARGEAQDNLINYVLVPEPASLAMLGLGALALIRRRR